MESKNSKLANSKKTEKRPLVKNMAGSKSYSAAKKAPVKIHKTAPRGK